MEEIYLANGNKNKAGVLASDNVKSKAKITKRDKGDILINVIILQKHVISIDS